MGWARMVSTWPNWAGLERGWSCSGRSHGATDLRRPAWARAWDQSISNRCFVTLVDAQAWREITGEAPPTKPPTAADYSKAGLPWFNYYADLETLGGAPALTRVKAVAEVAAEKGEQVLGPDGEVNPDTIITIGPGETHHPKAPPREK